MAQRVGLIQANHFRCLVYSEYSNDLLYLKMCGIERCMPEKHLIYDKRPGYHLHVVISGKGVICINDATTVHVHAGQIFLLKPTDKVDYRPDPEDPWVYCWVAFDGSSARRYVEAAGFTDGNYVMDAAIEVDRFSNLVQAMISKPELSLAHDITRTGYLCEFVGLLVENYQQSVQMNRRYREYSQESYVRYAQDLITANYSSITISDVAQNVGIHRSYLTNLFKKQLGISPQEYLLKFRLEQSCRLLSETQLPIQDVALRVGYENPLTFSKMFKNAYGISPRGYRKSVEDEKKLAPEQRKWMPAVYDEDNVK